MKNIHILPTDKPSRLFLNKKNNTLFINEQFDESSPKIIALNIYITSDEEITGFENNIWVIKGDRIFLWQNTMALVSNNKPKKIILTTDQDLIKDGVQAIDDDFLEWFVKNPSCKKVEVELFPKFSNKLYGIIIPKEEPKQVCENCKKEISEWGCACGKQVKSKQETIEEAADKWVFETNGHKWSNNNNEAGDNFGSFIAGAKWKQDKNKYSEEEVLELIQFLAEREDFKENSSMSIFIAQDFLQKFKNK